MRTRFADFGRLAQHGGVPVRSRPFAPWPAFDDEMLDAVSQVLKSGKCNYWTGDVCRQFEREFAAFVGTQHAVAVMNGTVAIELALHALQIQPGDEVIVPPRTFLATASAVAVRGSIPVFADIDPVSGNLTAASIAAALTPRTRAVIVVHMAGWPCEMGPIQALCRQHGLKLIEDCAQAHGATWNGQPVGSFGDIGAFSFCQDKIITTGGEGGLLTMNCPTLWDRAWTFKDHGKSWDAVYNRPHPTVFRWLHESIGTNWRLTEMQAAIGRIALQRLPEWVATRRRHAAILNAELQEIDGLEVLLPPAECGHSYYKYYVHVADSRLTTTETRDSIVRCLQAEGIPCGSGGCCEIYREKAITSAGLAPASPLPVASRLASKGIMFMVHPTLDEETMHDTVAALGKVMRAQAEDRLSSARAA